MKLLSTLSFIDLKESLAEYEELSLAARNMNAEVKKKLAEDMKKLAEDINLLQAIKNLIDLINSLDVEKRVKWMSQRQSANLDTVASHRVWNQLSKEFQACQKAISFLAKQDSVEFQDCELRLMQRLEARELTEEVYESKLRALKALRDTPEAKYSKFTCFTLAELAQMSMMLEELCGVLKEAAGASERVKGILSPRMLEVSELQRDLQAYVMLAYFSKSQENKSQALRASTGQLFTLPLSPRTVRSITDSDNNHAGNLFLLNLISKLNAIVDKELFSEKLSCWPDVSPRAKVIPFRAVFRTEATACSLQDYFLRTSTGSQDSAVGEKTPDLLDAVEDDIFDDLERMSPSEFLLSPMPIEPGESLKPKLREKTIKEKLEMLNDEIEKSVKALTTEWDRQFETLVTAQTANTITDFAHSAPNHLDSYMSRIARLTN